MADLAVRAEIALAGMPFLGPTSRWFVALAWWARLAAPVGWIMLRRLYSGARRRSFPGTRSPRDVTFGAVRPRQGGLTVVEM